MCPSLIQTGSKTAEKNSAQTNRHYENNGHLAMNQYTYHYQLNYVQPRRRHSVNACRQMGLILRTTFLPFPINVFNLSLTLLTKSAHQYYFILIFIPIFCLKLFLVDDRDHALGCCVLGKECIQRIFNLIHLWEKQPLHRSSSNISFWSNIYLQKALSEY